MGALTRNSSLAAWVVVLLGAFAMNLAYAVVLLFKNKSWNSFRAPVSGNAYKWAILAGLFWFAALGIYGQGSLNGNDGSHYCGPCFWDYPLSSVTFGQ